MNAKDEVVEWLRDAYAMERGLEVPLKKLSESGRQSQGIRSAAARHLEETRKHARTMELLLRSLGADISVVKTGIGMTTGMLKGLGAKMAPDEPVKDLLTSYAMEHFEIACYQALVIAAEIAGLPEVSDACAAIIADEEDMADMIRDSLAMGIDQYLAVTTRSKAA